MDSVYRLIGLYCYMDDLHNLSMVNHLFHDILSKPDFWEEYLHMRNLIIPRRPDVIEYYLDHLEKCEFDKSRHIWKKFQVSERLVVKKSEYNKFYKFLNPRLSPTVCDTDLVIEKFHVNWYSVVRFNNQNKLLNKRETRKLISDLFNSGVELIVPY